MLLRDRKDPSDIGKILSLRTGVRYIDEIRHLDDPNAKRLHETSSGVHLVLSTNYGYDIVSLAHSVAGKRALSPFL